MQVGRDRVEVRHGGLPDLRRIGVAARTPPSDRRLRGRGAQRRRAEAEQADARTRLTAAAGASSSTATAAPATAKSPGRRANSSTAKPAPPAAAGKVTPVSSSSGSSAVLQMPVKNSAAGMVRWPRGDSVSIVASRASATAGYSAAGVGVGE